MDGAFGRKVPCILKKYRRGQKNRLSDCLYPAGKPCYNKVLQKPVRTGGGAA